MSKKKKKIIRVFILLFLIVLIFAGIIGYEFYKKIYTPNTIDKTEYLYIRTGYDFGDVVMELQKLGVVKDIDDFIWVAEKKNYKNNVKPGRYRIRPNMSNNELVNMLRSGEQEPVKLVFNNIRTKQDLARVISNQIEAEEDDILNLLNDEDFAKKYGFNTENFLTMFIPNTYEIYWNTSAEQFIERMAKEYKNFWTSKRKNAAKEINLSQSEVSILASIVQAETQKNDEKPRIAGVYINRLKRKMPLEADPTLIYALGDFTIRRVLNEHKQIDSPYNTYKNVGLPPGPINLPEISSIDAVLNYEKHDYLYFCAKPELNGYHNFSKTYQQHLVYAKMYQEELNKRKIFR